MTWSSVIIPKTNSRVYSYENIPVAGGSRLTWNIRPEVSLWLKENTPTNFRSGSKYVDHVGSGHFYTNDDYIGEEWHFETKDQAALFKLTWA